ncbi:uncharacterized protein LOC126886911 [Diabrotica virgifera virgifera]|uniref:Uncharacterized protein n=1 Tax=Diabrotica virgifera virgifera TaxID=50390 RepID=A0ABM5KIV7_DIAVI|nr:uncharacterized protein LOC126886911 [Diabrotica virgifera virgifera]
MMYHVPYEFEVINDEENNFIQDPFDTQGINVDLLSSEVRYETLSTVNLNISSELLSESSVDKTYESTQQHENLEELEDDCDPEFIPPEKEAHQEDDSEYSDEEQNENNPDTRTAESRRKKKANSELWDKNVNKRKRMMGEEYVGYTRSKDGTVKHDTKRNKRMLGPICNSVFCKKAANRFCLRLSEEIRQTIFEKFWSMSWEQKRLYVLHMTTYTEKKRTYTKNPSRRKGTFQYYLQIEDGKHQVCKQTFLGTLGIKERMVRHWVNEGSMFETQSSQDDKNKNKTKKKDTSVHSVEQNRKLEQLRVFLDVCIKLKATTAVKSRTNYI